MRLRYHPNARDELRAAVLSKERERPGRGAALAAAIAQVERRIRRLPSSAPRWPGLSSPVVVRKARVRRSPYLVLYAELADELVVLAVAHSRQAPEFWVERLDDIGR
jgi:toxin ParE1/3/4